MRPLLGERHALQRDSDAVHAAPLCVVWRMRKQLAPKSGERAHARTHTHFGLSAPVTSEALHSGGLMVEPATYGMSSMLHEPASAHMACEPGITRERCMQLCFRVHEGPGGSAPVVPRRLQMEDRPEAQHKTSRSAALQHVASRPTFVGCGG